MQKLLSFFQQKILTCLNLWVLEALNNKSLTNDVLKQIMPLTTGPWQSIGKTLARLLNW